MNKADITGKVVLGTTIGLILWEAISLVSRKDRIGTISEAVVSESHKTPAIPFLLGALIGHWYWPFHKGGAGKER